MRYIFKILLLGLDGEAISFYALRALGEEGETKGAYFEWYKELNAFEDICDLEVDAISDLTNPDSDFDDMLGTVDGVIYFINPLNTEEIEIFDSILHDIRKIKRSIPIILMYYDQQGILPISVNELLENTWLEYVDVEAFVNLQPREFHQALQCLCLAMISGDTPLNIENAWMRFPIYFQLANIFLKKANKEEKPELYFYAAKTIEKIARIAEILNKEEYYIFCEQAAFLYSKVNMYLEASKILQDVDRKKAENYKRLHAESMLIEGNKLFNNRKFVQAAKQYLAAAQWSAIEIRDNNLMDEAFKLAINSYIIACRVENAFNILNNLPHDQTLLILRGVTAKIIAAADFLIKEENFVLARDQLYRAISVYQKEGLFEELEQYANKLITILASILKIQLKGEQRFHAKQTYDEIENLSKTYKVKKPDVDSHLETLIKQFLNNLDFGNATILTNSLNSLKLKKELTDLSSKVEDENKELVKTQIEENIKSGVNVLNSFIEHELDIFKEINSQIIKKANNFIEEGEYSEAAKHMKVQVEFLKRIGREEIHTEMIKKVLDILLVGKLLDQFFKIYYDLSKRAKKIYLRNRFPIIIEKLKEIITERDFEQIEDIFVNLLSVYREQLLYEQSKEVSEAFVDAIKSEAMRIVKNADKIDVIDAALMLIKKAKDISLAYLDNRIINFDKIYERIVEICIKSDKLPLARINLNEILNTFLKTELDKKIQKIEDEKSASVAKKAIESSEREISKEGLSIIKNKAREARQEKDTLLKQNKALRRAYFTDCLMYLDKKNYENAIKCYEENVNRLIDRSRLKLAGLSLVVTLLISIKQNQIDEFRKILNQTKNKLGSLEKSFSETFPVSLVEYILDIEKLGDPFKLQESLELVENLPLLDEEILLLNEILGKSLKKLEPEDLEKKIAEAELQKENFIELANKIPKEKKEIAKRELMKNQYWKLALEDLSNKKFEVAAREYKDTIPMLLEKKFYRQAALSLILNIFIVIKIKDAFIAKTQLKDIFTKYKELKSNFEDLPEIKILKNIIFALEDENQELINLCTQLLIEKLVLFEPETSFMETLILEEQKSEAVEEKLTRKEFGERRKSDIILAQKMAKLEQMKGDVKREHSEFLKQRVAMKKRVYTDVLILLESKSYNEAGLKYFRLAKIFSEKRDLRTSSLMILLHGLALIKSNESTKKIRSNVNSYLSSLGLNKQLVKDTYYLSLIDFILDVISNNMDKYLLKIKELLGILPLFVEEKQLIEIDM
jgi:2C-methyl-D-erythritol 2,4-cyclodiphosphate synthase